MKGYKATNFDMSCLGFQFELDKEYSVDGKMQICENGFHFCEDFNSINEYYSLIGHNRYFEIEALGEVITDGNKSCTNKIKLIRELTNEELAGFGIIIETDGDIKNIKYNGSQYWYLNGKYHREDGPAIIYADGSQYWYLNGKLHREDGPAVIWADGCQRWYLNGQLHREDGPAIIYVGGSQYWYLNGKLHREDGPAIIYADGDGDQRWYKNGQRHQ